jgi:hypothetical protein
MRKRPPATNKGRRTGGAPLQSSLKPPNAANGGKVPPDSLGDRTKKVVGGLKTLIRHAADDGMALSRAMSTFSPVVPAITLFIDRLEPTPLIENRFARVYFTIENTTSKTSKGSVRATIIPKHSIDPVHGAFLYNIDSLGPFDAAEGVISFLCPRADLGNKITLDFLVQADVPDGVEDFGAATVAATSSELFDIGARFSVTMQGIVIADTASHHNDTLLVTINESKDGDSWGNKLYTGDQNNTDSRGGLKPELGEYERFDAMMGEASGIGISYVLVNLGHSSSEETAKKILGAISDISAIVATTVCSVIFPIGTGLWAGLSAGVDALIHTILDYAFANCDTVVALDARFLSSDSLFSYTFDPDDSISLVAPPSLLRQFKKQGGQILPGAEFIPSGGCNDSDYRVQLAINRFRTSELFRGPSLDPVVLGYGQETWFAPLLPGWLQTAKIVYSNEGDGQITEKGQYRAPDSAGIRKYDVITWTLYRDTGNGPRPYATEFAIVVFE